MKHYSLFIIILLAYTIYGQNPDSIHYTTQNSPLPSNNIKEVLADTSDNIWMTTDSGLVKYSAGNWQIFNTSNSGIHTNNLDYFYIDNHNNLWFRAYSSNYGEYFKKFDGTNWSNSDTSWEFAGFPFAVDDEGGKWGVRNDNWTQTGSLAYVLNGIVTIYTEDDVGIEMFYPFQILVDKLNRFWIIGNDHDGSASGCGISYYSNGEWHTANYFPSSFTNIAGLDIDYERGLVWQSQTIDDYAGFTVYDYNDLSVTQRFNTTTQEGFWFFNDVRLDSSGEKIYSLETFYSSSVRYLKVFTPSLNLCEQLFMYPKFNTEIFENLEIDKFMNKYIGSINGLYIINEEGIIYEKSVTRNRNLYFDSTHVDSVSYKPLWLYNPYDSVLSIDSINFTSPDFYIEGFSAIQLEPLDSIQLIIAFNPSQARIYFEGLNVYDNYAMHTINLNGVGYGIVGIENKYDMIKSIFLKQNYPNPFNPTTNIEFTIPNPAFVTLKVYDVLGNEIKTLINEEKPSGRYIIKFDGSNLACGIYFYVLKSGSFIQSRKMLLLK